MWHPPPPNETQSKLFGTLRNADDTPSQALVDKIRRTRGWDHTNAKILADRICRNVSTITAPLPSFLRTHIFELIHNGLPTKHRIRHFSNTDTLCSLCGDSDETIDHLHTECKVSADAVNVILRHSFNKSSVTPIYGAGAADFKFEGDPRSPADMLTLLLFSAAVWRASSFYRVRGITPSNPRTAAMKIGRSFLSLRKKVLRRSTKKAKKDAKARKRIAALHKKLDSLGPHLEIATDGSSIPNPGPTGAGYVMREVDYGSNDYTFFSSTSLGHGTNNLGEIEALQSALNRVVSNLPPPGVKIIFLIDSEFALNIANSIHHSKAYPETASNIIQLRQTLQKTHTTLLEWSPAHFDFAINEVADGLAKRGAAVIVRV